MYNLRPRPTPEVNLLELDDYFSRRRDLVKTTKQILSDRPDSFALSGWTRCCPIKMFQSEILQEFAGQENFSDNFTGILAETTLAPEIVSLLLATPEDFESRKNSLDNFKLQSKILDQRSYAGFSNKDQFPNSTRAAIDDVDYLMKPDNLLSRINQITPAGFLSRIESFFFPATNGLTAGQKDRILRMR